LREGLGGGGHDGRCCEEQMAGRHDE
jgi:hypothetical protein